MKSNANIATFLAQLPRRAIRSLPAETPVPRLKVSGSLPSYNGFTGQERLRTFELAKWLMKHGAMTHGGHCSICGGDADQQHAEDYFDLRTWMDICRGCHISLHNRFRTPAAWERRLTRLAVAPEHWARALPTTQIDVASFHRLNGRSEPVPKDFVKQNG